MKKILVYTTAYLPLVGGAEVAIKEITERLENYEFTIITARLRSNLPKVEKVGRSMVYRVGFGSFLDKWFLPVLGAWLGWRLGKEKKYVAVWSVMTSFGWMATKVFLLRKKIPCLLTVQEGDDLRGVRLKARITNLPGRSLFSEADRIQVISSYLRDWVEDLGVKTPVTVVPNGVDLKLFQSDIREEELGRLRERYDLKYEEKIIISVSRLVYKNGVDVLVKAVKELEGVKLLLVGEGKEKKRLKSLVEKLDMEDRVVFVSSVKPEEVSVYLKLAQVFVRPSRTEGFGNAFIEAMAAGVPVVATKVGGIKDFLKSGVNGLVCEVDDPDSVSEKIKEVLENDSLREKLIEGGRETAKEYDWDIVSKKMERVLSGLLNDIKKMVIAAPIYPPDVGGPATYAEKIKEVLEGSGVEVRVVTYGDRSSSGKGVRVVSRRLFKGFRYIVFLLALFKASKGVDLIYALDAAAAGVPARLVSRVRGVKLFLRIGGDLLWERAAQREKTKLGVERFYKLGDYRKFRPSLFGAIKKVLLSAEGVVVPAGVLKDIYINFYGLEEKRIKVIPNIVSKPEKRGGEVQKRLIFAGRLVKYKNVDRIIRAIKDLDYELMIVGEGPEREDLGELVKELKIEDRVKFWGKVERGELKDLILQAGLGISIAESEYNPNFVLECLSLGLPVIINKYNGLTVRLPEESLVEVDSEDDIKEKIEGIFDNYDEVLEKIREAIKLYSYEDSVEGLLDFIS